MRRPEERATRGGSDVTAAGRGWLAAAAAVALGRWLRLGGFTLVAQVLYRRGAGQTAFGWSRWEIAGYILSVYRCTTALLV